MTRRKVKLAFILNEVQRKATLKKRTKGIMKKISELSTLCDVQTCAIVYSPHESNPEVWPSPYGVQQVLTRFKNMPSMEQSKKMANQESFLRQRLEKVSEQSKKKVKENRIRDINQVMFQGLAGQSLIGLNMMDLNDLGRRIDELIKDILKRQETTHTGSPNSHSNIVFNDNVSNNNSQVGVGVGDVGMAAPTGPMPLPMEDAVMAEVTTLIRGNDGGGDVGEGAAVVSDMPQPPEETLERPPGFEMSDRQRWFMEMINPANQIPFGGGPVGDTDDLLPFTDENKTGFNWPNDFFP